MGTKNVRTNLNIYTVSSLRLLAIPTSPATQVVMTNSASMGFNVSNIGPSTVAWGDTNITISSGGLLFYSMQKEFMNVTSGFSFYLIADSVAGTVSVIEYKA